MKLKALGLAVVVVLAVGAVVASSALAAVEFRTNSAPAKITAKQHVNNVALTATWGALSCTTVSFVGEGAASPTPSVELSTELSGCTVKGTPSVVDTNGCKFKLFAVGSVDVVCPVGSEITVTSISGGVSKCIFHVPAQTGLGTVTYTNVGSGETEEITMHIDLTGIKYSQTEGTGLGRCPTADNETGATLTGTATATGEGLSGITHVGITVS